MKLASCLRAAVVGLLLVATSARAEARTVCMLVVEAATGAVVVHEGDCETRVTPASTFKVPLAVMGFDAGFLVDARTPTLPFREGYPDWLDAWKQETDPTGWLRHSVVWYSQRITEALGAERLQTYAEAFGLGNADFSGDPGRDNGLERAWISSSLKVSPVEQVSFLRRLAARRLPVEPAAMQATISIMERWTAGDGWTVTGKTGSAYPRRADGSFDRDRGWGWFTGWAERDGRTLVFARLDQDEGRMAGPGGMRAREAFLASFANLPLSE